MAAQESRFEGGKEQTEMLWRHIGDLLLTRIIVSLER